MNDVSPFKVDGWTVFKTLLSSAAGWPVWTALSIGVILIGVGCVVDVRLMVVGLMICMAFVPCIAVFLYFSYTLSPEMVGNMIPHTVERTDSGFILRIWRREDMDEDTDEDDKKQRWVESTVIPLSRSNIVECKTSYEYELFFFKDSDMRILYVPRFKEYENIKEYQP